MKCLPEKNGAFLLILNRKSNLRLLKWFLGLGSLYRILLTVRHFTGMTKPLEIIVNGVSFWMFPFSK